MPVQFCGVTLVLIPTANQVIVMRGLTFLGFAVCVALVAVGCGPPKCACPGCTRPGNVQAEYVDTMTNGVLKRETVHICDEHYDSRPDKWPGEFHPETRTDRLQRQRKAADEAQRKQAEEERAATAKRAAYEKQFPENVLARSEEGDLLAFKPRFARAPQKGTVLALVYSPPAAAPLDEERLKKALPRLDAGDGRLETGLSPFPPGVEGSLRVTLFAPSEAQIADGVLTYFRPPELRAEAPAIPDPRPGPLGRVTGAIGEFAQDGPILRFLGFLTPVCEAKPFPNAD